jgi:hypothetical protein
MTADPPTSQIWEKKSLKVDDLNNVFAMISWMLCCFQPKNMYSAQQVLLLIYAGFARVNHTFGHIFGHNLQHQF